MDHQTRLDGLGALLEKNREAFANYNIVRMREALRYLDKDKFKLFIELPFFIHANMEGVPGYVDSGEEPCGIAGFEKSGFYREALNTGVMPDNLTGVWKSDNPAVQGLYHIGSLGTFTQSRGSDFDYWVIINSAEFSDKRFSALQSKLDELVVYSREQYGQEVSFFVHDAEDIKNNNFDPVKGDETVTAPRSFLKEEFYRTFLMIAGRIPFWAVFPVGLTDREYDSFVGEIHRAEHLAAYRNEYIDLGNLESISTEEIFKGILWHISKSKQDPVKALIKASMVACYRFGPKADRSLMCDMVKKGYAKAGIDDYLVDPNRLLFERVIRFYENMGDPNRISLIKNAIFFRLCGYPAVRMPEEGSPKKSLLDKYLSRWRLRKEQTDKLLSYTRWSESEKLLLEQTLRNTLAYLFSLAQKEIKEKIRIDSMDPPEARRWKILTNKAKELLSAKKGKIGECSIYLKRSTFERFVISSDRKEDMREKWYLLTKGPTGGLDALYSAPGFLGVMGWLMNNGLYNRYKSGISLGSSSRIYQGAGIESDPDKVYLSLQPVKPLSDNVFIKDPFVDRMVIVLRSDRKRWTGDFATAEMLFKNTWGELFFETLDLADLAKPKDKCYRVAMKIKDCYSPQLRFTIFQLAKEPCPKSAGLVREGLEKAVKEEMGQAALTRKPKPYLDIL